FAGGKWRGKLYSATHSTLSGQESRYRGNAQGYHIKLSEEDIAYLMEEVWNSKSVISDQSTRIYLTRWKGLEWGIKRPNEEDVLGSDNVVLMTKEEVKKHEQEVLMKGVNPETYYSKEVLEKVKRGFEKERYWRRY